jgi:HSP20 family molecular chaperone IbpA
MQNTTQFQTTPGFGNFTSNTGTATQSLWGESTGYGYNWGGTMPQGIVNAHTNLSGHPLLQAIGGAPSANQEIFSAVFQGQALFQSLFSENGLVLGPINGGAESFLGTSLETGQLGAISRFINLVQGVSSAQVIAYTGITSGHNAIGTGTGQGFGTCFGVGAVLGASQGQGFGTSYLTSLIHVRYFDNNSNFVIESSIVGGNTKNLNVTVVGEEIRIQKTDAISTGNTLANAGVYGNGSINYSLPLPNSADAKGITAVAKDGILTITLPKTHEISKNVRQITVK